MKKFVSEMINYLEHYFSLIKHQEYKKKPSLLLPIVLAVLGIALIVNHVVNGSSEDAYNRNAMLPGTKMNPTPVIVETVTTGTFKNYINGLGVITPLNTVEIRSRVDGQLMRVTFEEGQLVNKGDLLAEIDPEPFQVHLKLAEGQLERDRALLKKAKIDLERYHTLLSQDSISPQLVDTKESLVRQYQAAVKDGEGKVKNAKLKLSYTEIRAPISGRAGFRQVDPGNIVSVSDKKGLVTITQLNPVNVVFHIPEDNLPRVMKRFNSPGEMNVEVFDRELKKKLGEGKLVAVDNQIDVTTGTIKLKAELDNSSGNFFAHQFVNVKMPVEIIQNAVLVPASAVQHGSEGDFIFVVQTDETAKVVPATLGPSQGESSVVLKGVSAGDRVVVEGGDKLRDGSAIKIMTVERSDVTQSDSDH